VAVVLAATATAADLPGEPLGLEAALGRARAANPALRAAAAGVDAARGRLGQAGLWPANPVLSGALARAKEPGVEHLDGEVSLGQEIEIGGQGGLRRAAGRHDLARAEYALADRRRTVEAEVRRAFAELVGAGRRVVLAAEGVALAERLAQMAERRASAGEGTGLEVQVAGVERARAAQALDAVGGAQVLAAARLASLIGASADETVAVTAGDDAPLPPRETADALVARALSLRPDLAAAREEQARLESDAALVRRQGRVPNPTLRGFYREEIGNERIAGGEVSVPLPVWNRAQGTEIAAHAAAAAAASEVERLEREIPRQVRVALARRALAAASLARSTSVALPAANAARALLDRAYAGGYLGLPEVLAQQDRLREARVAAIGAWVDIHTADADLLEAVGGVLP
jgi:cobalt-zinc-cadmium efflux system outer membrane protein